MKEWIARIRAAYLGLSSQERILVTIAGGTLPDAKAVLDTAFDLRRSLAHLDVVFAQLNGIEVR